MSLKGTRSVMQSLKSTSTSNKLRSNKNLIAQVYANYISDTCAFKVDVQSSINKAKKGQVKNTSTYVHQKKQEKAEKIKADFCTFNLFRAPTKKNHISSESSEQSNSLMCITSFQGCVSSKLLHFSFMYEPQSTSSILQW